VKPPHWDTRYPDPHALRAEVAAMVEAIVGALVECVPESEIEGIYFKGSAKKEWDSPIDYVPELSDIDVHVLFAESSDAAGSSVSVEWALDVLARIEAGYAERCPAPIHVPRPQLVRLNDLLTQRDFAGSVPSTVSVLRGRPYPTLPLDDPQRLRGSDCAQLLEGQQRLDAWPLRVVDKPAHHLRAALHDLVWQVSPVVPRAVHLLGVPAEQAWSENRTHLHARLQDLGECDLADDYAQFYMSGWAAFLSGGRDAASARQTFISGIQVIRRGVAIARTWQAEHAGA
jgi:hypothetical protein